MPNEILPTFYDTEGILRAIAFGIPATVIPAQEAKTGRQQVFPARVRGVHRRWLQNVGTVAIKYWITDTPAGPVVATDVPHGILAPGSVLYDGLGSVVDLSGFGAAVWIDSAVTPGGTYNVLVGASYNEEFTLDHSNLVCTVV